MSWTVVYSNSFAKWIDSLSESLQNEAFAHIELLSRKGIALPFPYSSKINGSKVSGMRELRFKHDKRTIRILYVFDPRRQAVLLLGGDKTGKTRWYERHVPLAEKVYEDYLRSMKGGLSDENT